MPFTYKPDGSIVADTIDDLEKLIVLREGLNEKPMAPVAAVRLTSVDDSTAPTAISPKHWRGFLKTLESVHRKLLVAVKARGSITMGDLVAELGDEANGTQSISGYTTAIKRKSNKIFGEGPKDRIIYSQSNGKSGKKRVVTYYAGPMLKENEIES